MIKVDPGCHPDRAFGSVLRRTFNELFNVYKMYRNMDRHIDVHALVVNSGWAEAEVEYLESKLEDTYQTWLATGVVK